MAIPFTCKFRLRAFSYFSLPSYYTRTPSTRVALPRVTTNEGVSARRKNERLLTFVLSGDKEAVKEM